MSKFKQPRGVCECGDSIRSAIGECPDRNHREYTHCPKQRAITTKAGEK
ncbi:hypothetical protein SEA_YOSIF_61 [Streptomyces phage Yosif]|uniref:Uncharacterized protein n=1 Tax=Streptomyces phage Yosif TaxID=2201421 RepID=A0A2Z4QDI1_9CAUD|nr:hypothetical protein KGG71_gp61 [Streptomyces phage Yosif]AWY07625.1 hypothetical protein SEA_YOSIF_61 [Streptomyces phage Yosif]